MIRRETLVKTRWEAIETNTIKQIFPVISQISLCRVFPTSYGQSQCTGQLLCTGVRDVTRVKDGPQGSHKYYSYILHLLIELTQCTSRTWALQYIHELQTMLSFYKSGTQDFQKKLTCTCRVFWDKLRVLETTVEQPIPVVQSTH